MQAIHYNYIRSWNEGDFRQNGSQILMLFHWAVKHNFINLVVVVLPDPFRGMGSQKNYKEIQQLGHAHQRSKRKE